MPEIVLCDICNEEINPEKENFVIMSKEFKDNPRRIAHPSCAKKGYPPISIERG